jgi:hypothetical protein
VARKGTGTGVEYEHHVVGVRLRVTGAGNLQSRLSGLNDIVQDTLEDIPMQATNRLEPTVLANIQNQRIRYELFTTELNETFVIKRIIIYAKPVATEFPGGGI